MAFLWTPSFPVLPGDKAAKIKQYYFLISHKSTSYIRKRGHSYFYKYPSCLEDYQLFQVTLSMTMLRIEYDTIALTELIIN